MKKVSADTLQEAIVLAAKELKCSVTQLDYEVIQYERKGLFGLGKKQAIIIANNESGANNSSNEYSPNAKEAFQKKYSYIDSNAHDSIKSSSKANMKQTKQDAKYSDLATNYGDFFDASAFLDEPANQQDMIFSNTQAKDESQHFQTKEAVAQEILEQIQEMLSFMPFKINVVEVSFYDPQTLLIYLDGNDSALIIGERGYRYKALSYLLFNWIQPTYGYNVRLEIAKFLQNQEEAIESYLVGIINEVKREGKAQTKPLDGILAFIALKKLRSYFPDKYISFRQNNQNERYIVINDFFR